MVQHNIAFLNDENEDVVGIPDSCSALAHFQYRIWFVRRRYWSGYIQSPHEWVLEPGDWVDILRVCPWLWADQAEDEECIRAFADDSSLLPQMPREDWVNACLALEEHPCLTPNTHPLHPLTSQSRLRFVAWLMVVAAFPRRRVPPTIQGCILDWAELISITVSQAASCEICHISCFLPIWVETMGQVYELDHLRSIPWNQGCDCWESYLASPRETCRRDVCLDTASPFLNVLYELVVPRWPLVCWVALRTILKDATVGAFLDMLHPPDRDILEWDDDDNTYISTRLQETAQPGFYTQEWTRYMFEIDLQTWRRIREATWAPYRSRQNVADEDIGARLITLTLKHSPTWNAFERNRVTVVDIISPFTLDLEGFNRLARPIKDHTDPSSPAAIDSKEFWALPNLKNWLEIHHKVALRTMWHGLNMSALARVRMAANLALGFNVELFQNLGGYVYSRMAQQLKSAFLIASLNALQEHFSQMQLSTTHSRITNFASERHILFDFLRRLLRDNCSESNHTVSIGVYESMNRDIPRIVVELVRALKEPDELGEIMTARGSEAQRLLNLFQDLLDLDSFSVIKPLIFKTLAALSHASGLHPQCFPIPGLQKLGHQVAGGGFGDIWKGLVNGQSVSVKIMRIFQERTIEAASKEFGREALIWRQLSHPNLLPFYGLYYFEDRLCLVSPWMEHGNILEFLRKDPPNINRVSLILDVALGLQYLHQENVIHGDLKAINILVTPSRRACICDFGLSSIVNDITLRLIHSTTNAQQGTARYLAPELLRSNGKKHFLSDVYAFACVSYEILTGNVPFHTEKNDMVVMLQVLEGVRPTQPAACSGTRQLNSVWKLLESCWEADPQMRPTAGQIVERLVDPLVGAKTTTSTTDWDDQSTCKFRRSLQDWPLLPSVNQIECRLFGNEAAQACRQCFPAREMFPRSSRKNLKDIVPKRQYMGDTSDSREDNLRPETKRSRTSMSDFKSQRGTKRRMGTSYYQNPYKFSEQQSTPRF